MSAHDRYLANHRWSPDETVWCSNPKCEHHTSPTTATYESEYGQGWYTPEECECGGQWTQDEPKEEEDDDDDAGSADGGPAEEEARNPD